MKLLAFALAVLPTLAAATPPPDPEVERLIDQLPQVGRQQAGMYPYANWREFIAIKDVPEFTVGMLGPQASPADPAMTRLVQLGVRALPGLLAHLSDSRETGFTAEHPGGFGGMWFSNEYDPRSADPEKRPKGVLDVVNPAGFFRLDVPNQSYRFRVGDLCFVAIGQIVNRNLNALRYQPTACQVVNSPLVIPDLAAETRQDWSNLTAEEHKQSLENDAYAYDSMQAGEAVKRLLYYYPDDGKRITLQLLNREIDDYTDLSNYIDKMEKATTLTQWKSFRAKSTRLFDPDIAELIPAQILLDYNYSKFADPKKWEQMDRLLHLTYPDFNPYISHRYRATDFAYQEELVESLAAYKDKWVDEAIAGAFKRASHLTLAKDDFSLDMFGLACYKRLAGDGYDDLFENYFDHRLKQVQLLPRDNLYQGVIEEIRTTDDNLHLRPISRVNVSDSPDLLSSSQVVVKAGGWTSMIMAVEHYIWLPTHKIIFWEGPKMNDGVHLLGLFDPQTGTGQELGSLSDIADKNHFDLSCQVSPDGNWLLFAGIRNSVPRWYVCHLDGSGLVSWPRRKAPRQIESSEPRSLAHWSADGDSIIETETEATANGPIVHLWKRSFPNVQKEEALPTVQANLGYDWADTYDLGDGQLEAVKQAETAYERLGAILIHTWPTGKPADIRHFQMDLPNNTSTACELSPDRKKILWQFTQGRFPPRQSPTLSLWVSDVDGRNLKMIGAIPVKDDWESDEDRQFSEFHWLPDSKAVSFMYSGVLYKAPIPQ